MSAVKPTAEDYEAALQEFAENGGTHRAELAVFVRQRAANLASHRQPESALGRARNARSVEPGLTFIAHVMVKDGNAVGILCGVAQEIPDGIYPFYSAPTPNC